VPADLRHRFTRHDRTVPLNSVISLVVFQWSNSFETLWPELATASGVRLDVAQPTPVLLEASASRRDAITLHAVGGMETSAIEAIGRHAVPGSTVLVGSALDHRVAVRAIRSGAEEYFAMPGDLEALRTWLGDTAGD